MSEKVVAPYGKLSTKSVGVHVCNDVGHFVPKSLLSYPSVIELLWQALLFFCTKTTRELNNKAITKTQLPR